MSDLVSHLGAILSVGLILLIYVAVGAFLWSVARSLRQIARQLERITNRLDLANEATQRQAEKTPHGVRVKSVPDDSDWPLSP